MEKDKILVVEDEKDASYILEKLLSKNNFEVEKAGNGLEALEILKTFVPKVILADWTMPVMDGLNLCDKVKSDPKLRNIYFIILTAKTSLNDRVTGLDVGADDFLIKPIENQELLARIRSGIRIFNLQSELSNSAHTQALVELACTIGHSLNNPLSSLILSLQNLKSDFTQQKLEKHSEDFEIIEKSIERIELLISQLTKLENPQLIDYTDKSKMIKLD